MTLDLVRSLLVGHESAFRDKSMSRGSPSPRGIVWRTSPLNDAAPIGGSVAPRERCGFHPRKQTSCSGVYAGWGNATMPLEVRASSEALVGVQRIAACECVD